MIIRPARSISGSLRLPGDKAISHRAAIIAALAEGATRVENFSTGEDSAATLACLKQLGVSLHLDGATLSVEGVGREGLRASREPLDCRNSGSTMRMLAGVLAGQDFETILTGDESLRARPMKRIIEPLERMGAHVKSENGHAPLRIRGRATLSAMTYEMRLASAQVKTAILLAGLFARGRTEVIERPGATRDHTERMLGWFGVPLEITEAWRGAASVRIVAIEGQAEIYSRDMKIPGDISSAAFFIAAAAILPRSRLLITDVGLNRTRSQFLETLRSLGAQLQTTNVREECNEPVGDVSIMGGHYLSPWGNGQSNIINGALVPQLIDELPMMAIVGTQVEGGITIRDARELRVKESDRIAATVANLRAMGASVEEHEDGLTVRGRTRLRGARLNAYGDHRIAMAFTIAALAASGESEIVGSEAARVSFPEFYKLLESVVER